MSRMSSEDAYRRAMDELFKSILTECEIVELNLPRDEHWEILNRLRKTKRMVTSEVYTRKQFTEAAIRTLVAILTLDLPTTLRR